ncbi:MAG: hypothetical protein J2P30_28515, partial [Actinobacteria bacterium]|nr:hypothetical protein [Actinomycetota bacterium]
AVLAERRDREHARLAASPGPGSPEPGAPGRGFPEPGSPGSGPAGEGSAGADHPGPAVAWREPAGAARKATGDGEPERTPPEKGAGGFVPPA